MFGSRWPAAVGRPLLVVVLSLALLLAEGAFHGVAAGPPGRDLPDWAQMPTKVYFAETGHTLADPFLFYWRTSGERRVFGLPISEPIPSADGKVITQYFERMALQYRVNAGGATQLVVGYGAVANDVVNLRTGPGTAWGKVGQLTRDEAVKVVGGPLKDAQGAPWYQVVGSFGTGWSIGQFLERQDDPVSIATQTVAPNSPQLSAAAFKSLAPIVVGALGPDSAGQTFFPSTGHSLSGDFKTFWETNGGATLLGLPLSEQFNEVSPADGKVYRVQYFEHVKMEYHPEAANQRDVIQLALLGRQAASAVNVPTAAVARPASLPLYSPDLFEGMKWIEVNLSEQRLTAWNGDAPLLTTLVRSGKPGWQTPTGTFRVLRKVLQDDMTLGDPSDDYYYYTPNVPWVMYFLDGGFAIHGAVMDSMWGTPTSHGCVNVPVDIAQYLYGWAPVGTLIWIHN
jgi:lipoprotein-anchoring transpeptidase ErfK/SrfK